MTYLIDIDVLVDFFKHKGSAIELISNLSKNSTLILSTITITELCSGWTSDQVDFFLHRLYDLCSIIPVNKEIAEQAGVWRHKYMSQGISLGTPDTIIAATAYLNNSYLITNNSKDYPMPELKLYKHIQEKDRP